MKRKFLIILSVLLCMAMTGCGRKTAGTEIRSFEDLSGKTIGVQAGTLYEDYVYERIPDANVELYTDPNTMLLSLSMGKIDAYVTDRAAVVFEKKAYPEIVCMDEVLAAIPCTIGVGEIPGKEVLLLRLNDFLSRSRADGTLDEMRSYWLENCDEDNDKVDRTGITGENGKLVIGVEGNYIPFSYIHNQLPEGYDIDFAYRFCRRYGYEPVIEMMEYDGLSPALASGKCDIAMNIIYDEEREEGGTLSDPYYNSEIMVGYFGKAGGKRFSLQRIADSFKKTFIKESRWQQFVNGAVVSLLISASSIIIGTLSGLILYIFCRRGGKTRNKAVDVLSRLVEGTPTVVLLMIFYFIIFGRVNVAKIVVSIVVFSLMFTLTMFSMLKSGELAVGPGQMEAALSQGFSEFAAYIRIVLPQSAIHFLPQYNSEVVSLINETSIVGYIAILDLTKISDMIRGRTFEPFFPLISTAIIYFVLAWLLTAGSKKLYRSLCPETRDLEKKLRGLDDN